MRRPEDLSREELIRIADAVQAGLYLDLDHEREFYNPDKVWNGAVVCQELAWLLDELGMVPGEPIDNSPEEQHA